jgi:hypothetical protein
MSFVTIKIICVPQYLYSKIQPACKISVQNNPTVELLVFLKKMVTFTSLRINQDEKNYLHSCEVKSAGN